MRLALPLALLAAACSPGEPHNATTALPADLLAPPAYGLSLFQGPWVQGAPTSVKIRGAVPGDTLSVVLGLPGLSCPAVLGGLCADLVSPSVVATGTADASGRLELSPTIPAAVPIGFARRVQVAGGLGGVVELSNPWDRSVVAACPGGGTDACTLVSNGGIDEWAEPWQATPTVMDVTWDTFDRGGDATSGSLRVESLLGSTYTSAWQCVPVSVGQSFELDGYTYLPSASTGSHTFAEYIFYANDDCTGSLVDFDEDTWTTATDAWIPHGFALIDTPTGAASVRVGMGIIGTGGAGDQAYIDDLSFVEL